MNDSKQKVRGTFVKVISTMQAPNRAYIRDTELLFGAPESEQRDLSNGGIKTFRQVLGNAAKFLQIISTFQKKKDALKEGKLCRP